VTAKLLDLQKKKGLQRRLGVAKVPVILKKEAKGGEELQSPPPLWRKRGETRKKGGSILRRK